MRLPFLARRSLFQGPQDMSKLIGREAEQAILQKAIESDAPELVAIYGRRRVGKTFLIRESYEQCLGFELTGVHDTSVSRQLSHFASALAAATRPGPRPATPRTWQEAFEQLAAHLGTTTRAKKRVVFLDEFPWLASRRSGFLPAFEHFWNAWGSRQANLVVVICGSAASWMIRKIIHDRGGLHNRITRRICLRPFTLAETRKYLEEHRVRLDDYQVLELYMAMGGIPHYLKEIEPGRSAAENIDRICFSENGLLRDEFGKLYQSLFQHADRHIRVIRCLAKRHSGLTRDQILKAVGRATGGGTTDLLDELVESGFVLRTVPFGKTRKESLYRLADEYSLFYLKWIERHLSSGKDAWLKKQSDPAWKAWCGYAFETVCLKHVRQLKQALGIAAVDTVESSWHVRSGGPGQQGAQIDLLIDRRDNCINACEMKFSNDEFVINKRYATELSSKLKVFRQTVRTRKTLFLTMVTLHGVKDNEYRRDLVSQSLTAKSLFT